MERPVTTDNTYMGRKVYIDEHMAPDCLLRTMPVPAEVIFSEIGNPLEVNWAASGTLTTLMVCYTREVHNTATESRSSPVEITSLACGAAHVIVIDSNHDAWTWGDVSCTDPLIHQRNGATQNSCGQLAHGSVGPYQHRPQLIESLRGLCVKAAGGRNTTLLMTSLLKWARNQRLEYITLLQSYCWLDR